MCRRHRPIRTRIGATHGAQKFNDGSGTSSSGSKSNSSPSPSHARHMPLGELNENNCGLGGSNELPQSGHEYFDENTLSARATPPPATSPTVPSKISSFSRF